MSSNDNEDVDAWRDSCCLKSDFEGYEDGLIESLDLREETGDTEGDEHLGLIMSWDLALSHVRDCHGEILVAKELLQGSRCRRCVSIRHRQRRHTNYVLVPLLNGSKPCVSDLAKYHQTKGNFDCSFVRPIRLFSQDESEYLNTGCASYSKRLRGHY